MQEDIEHRSITLAVNGSKFTGRMLKNAIAKLLKYMNSKRKQSKEVLPQGKQTVKQLVGQNQGVTNIEIKDEGIKDFERIAHKYGVDFAVKKVKGDKPKYLVFFKGRDTDALTAAFTEYTNKRMRQQERPSVLKSLAYFKELAGRRQQPKHKNQELSL